MWACDAAGGNGRTRRSAHRPRPIKVAVAVGPRTFACPRDRPVGLLVRVFVSRGCVLVGKLTVFMSGGGVLLGLVVLAEIVMMRRLMVMMRGGVVVSGGVVMMLARRMLCHFGVPPDGFPPKAIKTLI